MGELTGDSVFELPVCQRSIGPLLLGDEPLFVGWSYQGELYRRTVGTEWHDVLRRCGELFAIFRQQSGKIMVEPRVAQPHELWHVRKGETPVKLRRTFELMHGDCIGISAGGNPAHALRGSLLFWHFSWVECELH